MNRRRYGVLFLLILGISIAFTLRPDDDELPVDLVAISEGETTSDFELEDLDGERVRLSRFKNQVVLINFWATWCPPCREEMPSLQNAAVYFDDQDFTVLAINVGETNEQVRAFVDEYGLSSELTVLLDYDSHVFERLGSRVLPTSLIVDRSGHLRYRAIGPRQFDSEPILKVINTLIETD
jgi:peroxiredoxin